MSHDGVAFINVSLASFDTNTNLMKDGFYHHDINIVFRNDAIIYRGCQVLRPQRGELQREQRRVQPERPRHQPRLLPLPPAQQDQDQALAQPGPTQQAAPPPPPLRHRAHRRRARLLHRGARRHPRGGPPVLALQLHLLAEPGPGDHARHLVPRHQLAARGLRARGQDRGRAHEEVPGPQDGGLRVGREDLHEEGDTGETAVALLWRG